ncbi:Deoxynucleoside triphosphate triphosphohydrolase SAMHD1 [Liparis tanakae]|uniref:Deoxynucleoside triphosphate triphosphohydrolase SAMHD1 n=1 Tax=Liparis tanakae TaxID=230148 RepID=A0A4Z2ES05_9TELE|nr:Deoxynucleoside triphosphate triphosphohydrolase SAMHD1 [Liparis tanakae]
MEAYTKLTDDVFGQILHSSGSKLKEAREILKKIVNRQHYRFLGEIKPTKPAPLDWVTDRVRPVQDQDLRSLVRELFP